jgi:uncharacterized damage-inducible protein DinB
LVYDCIGDYFCFHSLAIFTYGSAAMVQGILKNINWQQMKSFFNQLFEYNRFMNNELIRAIVERNDLVSDKSLEWMNHILNAHQIWNSRIIRDHAPFGVWALHGLDELSAINESNYESSITIIRNTELTTITEYTNSKGHAFKNSVRDILFHVINHSTYHRGQVAVDFRQTGIEPLETDYDAYLDCLKS